MSIFAAFVTIPLGLVFLVSGLIINLIQINLYTDAETLELLGKEYALVLSNHRSDIDWLIGWVMAQRAGCLGSALGIVRKEAKYLRIIGWAMWFSEYIFLEKTWTKDENILKTGFNQLKDFPYTFWLALYVEGSRLNQENLEAAKDYASLKGLPSPRNVLITRTKAFVSAVTHMRSFVPAIYDCTFTVHKSQSRPTMLTMLNGQSSEVNMQIRRYRMSAKDAQLENYFTNDVFSDLDVHQVGRPIKPLIVVLAWFCLLIYGSFKLLQWISLVNIICLFVVLLVIATSAMRITIQSSKSKGSSTPARNLY